MRKKDTIAYWFYSLGAWLSVGCLLGWLLKYDYYIDTTKDKKFSLSQESKEIVQSCQNTTDIYCLYYNQEEYWLVERFNRLKQLYSQKTDKLHFHLVHMYRDLKIVEQLREKYQTDLGQGLLMTMGDKHVQYSIRSLVEYDYMQRGRKKERHPVKFMLEQKITLGLKRMLNKQGKKLFMLIGHGEIGTHGRSGETIEKLKAIMHRQGVVVEDCESLEGIQGNKDSVLAVLSPREEIRPQEAELLRKYLKSGMKVWIACDPGCPSSWREVWESLGVTCGDDIVLDKSMLPKDPSNLIVIPQEHHEVLKGLWNVAISMRLACSLKRVEQDANSANTKEITLVETSPKAWVESDWRSGKIKKKEVDFIGKVPVLAILKWEEGDQRSKAVIMGDSDIVTDHHILSLGNMRLAENIVAWLTQSEDQEITVTTLSGVSIKEKQVVKLKIILERILFIMLVLWGLGIIIQIRQDKEK